MNLKKSQVTAFVIFGIILIVLVSGFIFLESHIFNFNLKKIGNEIEPIHLIIEDCVSEIAERAVLHVGKKGGYYEEIPEPSFEGRFPYYFYDGKNYIPDKEEIEHELSLYMNERLPDCVDFSDFSDLDIDRGKVYSNVLIKDESVIFDIEYPVSITKEGEKTYFLRDFKTDVPVRLGKIYNAIRIFTFDQVKHGNDTCNVCLNAITRGDYFRVNVYNINENATLFTFIDNNSSLQERFIFNFVNKYNQTLTR
ncbi:hypothetical protein GF386_00155 [Candidatus Pacearchaeota archaeon]|nr:hypothetical protein [Candidatus Pacearchaeota archaeon]MBD3282694.1 hypothetical protein [Candidatus Pacearchaeota archaeon]